MFSIPARPIWSRVKSEKLLKKHDCDFTKPFLLGVRGFFAFEKSNKRGKWDDLIALISPTCQTAFNANTDPSIFKLGIASLCEGKWIYKIGLHKSQYKALVQDKPVSVKRDNCFDYPIGLNHEKYGKHLGDGVWSGMFGINIHKGGVAPFYSTSSLGCQTLFRPQWEEFITTVEFQMKRYKTKTIPYFLVSSI